MKNIVIGSVSAVIVTWGIFVSSLPYYSLHHAQSVIESGDKDDIKNMLKNQVDFLTIKDTIKFEMMSTITTNLLKNLKGNPFAGLALGLALPFVEKTTDTLIDPTFLANKWAKEKPEFSDCEVKLEGYGKANIVCNRGITFVAQSSWFSWKIVDCKLDQNFFKYMNKVTNTR
jgi:Protein of unknown function (DUF2939)